MPERPDAERRSHRRHAADLRGRIGGRQPLHVRDLSRAGARALTVEALAPRRRYDVEIGPLQVTATVERCVLLRCMPDEEGGRPLFDVGLRFVPLAPAQSLLLQRLLAALRPGLIAA